MKKLLFFLPFSLGARLKREDIDIDIDAFLAEFDYQTIETTDSDLQGIESNATESGTCAKGHELEGMCKNNDEQECKESVICKWCQNSCNADTDELAICDEKYNTLLECIFEQKKDRLAEVTSLSEDDANVVKSALGQIKLSNSGDEKINSEARNGFMTMFSGANFGQVATPLIPFASMPIENRLSAQYITCPVNVPFCQRQECTSSYGNPQQSAMDCYRIAGCCFDNDLFVYKSAFGAAYFSAPVCYRAIRTPLFHALAEQITMTTEFLPNFLIPITDKVDAFIADEGKFNLMLEYHQCLSEMAMAPSRIRLENYLQQVWPGYIWMRMRPQGENFLAGLVDTLSQTCGWEDITSRECMMVGCCWNTDKTRCTHPTDLTKIPPQKLIATATWMLTMDTKDEPEEPVVDTAVTNSNTGSLPIGVNPSVGGIPPGIGTESRSGESENVDNFFLQGLSGRRRRTTRSARGKKRGARQINYPNPEQTMGYKSYISNQEGRQGLAQPTFVDVVSMLRGNNGAANTNPFGANMGSMGSNNANMGGMGSNNMNMGFMGSNMGSSMNMNPLTMALMGGNSGGSTMKNMLMANMMGGGNTGMNSAMMNAVNGLSGVNSQLFSQMGVSNTNPFQQGYAPQKCPLLSAKLNCMTPPKKDEKIDALYMMNVPKQCEVKGCCWDQELFQRLLLSRNSANMQSVEDYACPWKVPQVGSKYGMPDLTPSIKGCCSISPCVHTELPAEWTLWGEWTECTQKCGGGESVRSRSCIGNGFCPGMVDDTQREDIQSKRCNDIPCERWAPWANYGSCDAQCGPGEQTRYRSCIDINNVEVAPPGTSRGCQGTGQNSQPCQIQPCPKWGHWQNWSSCSASCSVGQKQRQRMCNLPGQCSGNGVELTTCGSACWDVWAQWSACSKTCFGGQQARNRNCLFQQETGTTCRGAPQETTDCNQQFCESWLQWQPWSSCVDGANTCGTGTRLRIKECTGRVGAPGCTGEGVVQEKCSIGQCMWSEWAQNAGCSKSCGEGTALYSRSCSRPGLCPGEAMNALPCSEGLCPGFQEWGEWASCDTTCGSGTRSRNRVCNGQINVDCRGSENQVLSCIGNPACPNKYGNQANPYGNQANPYGNYNQQNTQNSYNPYGTNNYGASNSAYGNTQQNALSTLFGNQPTNNNAYGQTANNAYGQTANNAYNPYAQNGANAAAQPTNSFNNLFGNSQLPQSGANTANSFANLFGNAQTAQKPADTMSQYYNNMQANPWANVFGGMMG